ncbi:hypothetical protein K474DRAFT_769903 [Panus rudis PR-1116 ss-1]|nr:hypothetical protein K474DRAFT_769903 [Panus rudis PR-1116 ss-1]
MGWIKADSSCAQDACRKDCMVNFGSLILPSSFIFAVQSHITLQIILSDNSNPMPDAEPRDFIPSFENLNNSTLLLNHSWNRPDASFPPPTWFHLNFVSRKDVY